MPRFTKSHIVEALEETHGNVSAASKKLGLARNSLYKRLVRFDLDPAAYRIPAARDARDAHGAPAHAPLARLAGGTVQQIESAIFPASQATSTLPPVQAERGNPTAVIRIRARKGISLRKDQLRRISHARRRVAAALDTDLTDSSLIERFIDAALDEWVAAQLKPAPRTRPEEKP